MRRRRAGARCSSFERVVVRRERGGVVAGCGQRAGTARERRHGLRRDPQRLLERRGRRLRVTERRQQVRVGGERRVRGVAAARDARSARARNRSRSRVRPSRPASLTSRRATSSSSGRSSSARSARSSSARRIGPVNLPVRAGGGHGGDRNEQGHDERQTPHTQKDSTGGSPADPAGARIGHQKNRPPSPHHCERRGPSEDFEKVAARLREAAAEAADVDRARREQAQQALAPFAHVVANQASRACAPCRGSAGPRSGSARRRRGTAARRWPR